LTQFNPFKDRHTNLLIFVFVFGFCASFLSNLLDSGPRLVLHFDARHYYQTCHDLVVYARSYMSGRPDDMPPLLVQGLLLDGPVLPGLSALFFTIAHKIPRETDWRWFLVFQSLLQAGCAVLVAVLSERLTNSRRCGVVTGVVWALWPAAVIAAGRLMSETLATLILLGIPALSGRGAGWKPALPGLLCGLLALVKPALLPAGLVVAIFSIAYSQRAWKNRLIATSILALAFVLTVAPWAVFTKITTGKAQVTISRQSLLNIATGVDFETQGWDSIPVSPYIQLFGEQDPPSAVLVSAISQRPVDWIKLSLTKISRLWCLPWNDFSRSPFGLDPNVQNWLHWGLLATASIGVIVWRRATSPAVLIGCLIVIAGHLAYLAVEAVPRYAFPSLPFMLVLASSGIYASLGLGGYRRLLWLLPAAVLVPAGLVLAHYFDRHDNHIYVSPGTTLSKTIELSERGDAPPREALLLIDASKEIIDSAIAINGHHLTTLADAQVYFPEAFGLLGIERQSAFGQGKDIEDFRRWRAVPVPVENLELNGKNRIDITAGGDKCKVYVNEVEKQIASLGMFSPGLFHSDPLRMEGRPISPIRYSKLTTGPRVHLLISYREAGRMPALPGSAIGLDSTSTSIIRVNKQSLKKANSNTLTFPISQGEGYSHIRVRIEGQIKATHGRAGVMAGINSKRSGLVILPHVPDAIAGSSSWKIFSIEDEIPIAAVGDVDSLSLAFYPGRWDDAMTYGARSAGDDAMIKNLHVNAQYFSAPSLKISGCRIY
jgi:hypothetical protein